MWNTVTVDDCIWTELEKWFNFTENIQLQDNDVYGHVLQYQQTQPFSLSAFTNSAGEEVQPEVDSKYRENIQLQDNAAYGQFELPYKDH